MKINYILGPQGCGKSTHLEIVANKAQRKGLPVVRARPDSSGLTGLQGDLRRAKPHSVILLDDERTPMHGNIKAYETLQYPIGAQVFVAAQGIRNTWANLP